MPVRDLQTFTKYVSKNMVRDFDVDKTISQTIENTEKFKIKNIQLTLLAAHHFDDNHGNVYAGYMYTGDIIPPHNHDYYEINYVISGKCVEYIADRVFVLEEGEFLIMPPSVTHSPAPVGDSCCVNMLFRAEWVSSFEQKMLPYNRSSFLTQLLKQNSYMVFDAKNTAAFSTACNITEYFKNKDGFLRNHELYADALGEKFLLELAECSFSETSYATQKNYAYSTVFEAILHYIVDNISTTDIESTANHFGYTPTHITRIIKKHTGFNFKTYLMLQRILRAEDYLLKTDIPISEIASLIGLDSAEYFSRVFKRFNNITPSQYRKTRKNHSKEKSPE